MRQVASWLPQRGGGNAGGMLGGCGGTRGPDGVVDDPMPVEIDAASADSYVAGLPRAEPPGGESQ